MKDFFLSIVIYCLCLMLVGIYVLLTYFIGHSFWPYQSSGSLVFDNGNNIRGSTLIAGHLKSEKYFKSRPAIDFDPNCDVALYNSALKEELLQKYDSTIRPYDITMIMPSSSGLDPFITRREAINQALAIAKARNINPEEIYKLIDENTIYHQQPFFELDIVNSSVLNFKLDDVF